ncbi:MAG: serine/threonine-protein kinase [Gemmataceae bacterium]
MTNKPSSFPGSAPTGPSASSISGHLFLDRYEAVRFIGHGSMGQVWLARDHKADRDAVVKLMHERVAGRPKFRELFEREMRFMARFKHPHAVEFYDAALESRFGPFIVMEYIPGVGLDAILARHRLLHPERAGNLLLHACRALHAAHAAGIVHRDLKPANFMVIDPDYPYEALKVMDLGLARFAAKPYIPLEKLQGETDAFAVGTPAYIAPEQLRGDETDHRADVYSLGVVLYEMLAGRLPFEYDDPMAMLQAHVEERPPTFAEIGVTHVAAEVEIVVQMCLAKFANERPQTAYDVASQYWSAMVRSGAPDPREFQPESVVVVETAGPPKYGDGTRLVECFEAWMPEKIALVKLRGFVEDQKGRVVASEPGLIRVRIGEPEPDAKPPARPSLFGLFKKPEPPPGPPPVEPVALDLYMTKKDGRGQSHLELTVVCRALSGPLPADLRWHERCRKLYNDLRAYVMAR